MGCVNNTLTRSLDAENRPNSHALKLVCCPDIHLLITYIRELIREFQNFLLIKPQKPPDLPLPK